MAKPLVGLRISSSDVKRAQKALAGLPAPMQRKAIRPAVSAALTPMNKASKKEAPVETKQLKKSIGRKVKTFKSGTIWGGVSARRGYKSAETGRNPTNYLHLVLFGHRIAKGGTLQRKSDRLAAVSRVTGNRGRGASAGRVEGDDFLLRAFTASKNAALAKFRAKFLEKLPQVLAKFAQRRSRRR